MKKNKEREEKIAEIRNYSKDRFIYDPLHKSVSFCRRKPTDYKLNRYVHLPEPLDCDGEFQCELRRRKYMQVLAKYKVIKRDEENGFQRKKDRRSNSKRVTTTDTDVRRKRYKKKVKELNLNIRGRKGLESLRKRVQEGELVIAQTDKSSRFSVLSREQYFKSGTKHTSKDTEIDWKHIKTLQRNTNGHVW